MPSIKISHLGIYLDSWASKHVMGDPNGINTFTRVKFTSVRSVGGHSYTVEGGGNAAFHITDKHQNLQLIKKKHFQWMGS
jgi:hypothetical protein